MKVRILVWTAMLAFLYFDSVCFLQVLLGEDLGNLSSGKPSIMPQNVEETLWWLPPDTETVLVAHGPLELPSIGKTGEQPDVGDALLLLALGPLASIKGGVYYKSLVGSEVSLCMEGSRKFRSPKGLGMMRYEGCNVVVFKKDLELVGEKLLKALKADTVKTENLEGFEVLVFEEKAEEDTWTFYVVRPRPDLLLTATNIDYLKTVLSRMKARGKTRSFPENLPEWKQVDLNARFWAIRHYDPKDAAEDPSSPLREQAAANFPDKEAVGLTFAYNAARGKTAKVIYLSGNKKAADIVSPLWKSEGNVLQPTIRQIVGGVEITVEVEPQKARHLLFVLLSALGHAIYL